MKHLNFLSKSSSRSCGHSSVTLASTVGSPSIDRRGTMLKLLSVLVLILTLGVGQMWGGTYEYDFSSTSNWYTTSAKTTNVTSGSDLSSFYDKNGVLWSVSSSPYRARFNSGYFILGKTDKYITLPTFNGEKITSVVVKASGGHSTSVAVNIYTTGGDPASTAQTWSTQGQDHTYSIGNSYQSSTLRIQVTNAYSTQFTKVTINTESTSSNTPTITKISSMTTFGCNMTTGVPTKQSFTVSGTNLKAAISVTPPSGYEISTAENGTYQSTAISLSKNGSNAVATTTIWVRLKEDNAAGSYSGNIACESTDATTQNVAVSGSTPFKVTWVANNNTESPYATTYVTYASGEGTALGSLPTDPDPDDYCGDVFYGWYEGSYKNASVAPSVISTSTKITEDKTYNAVFADEEDGGSTTKYKLVSSLTNGKDYIFVSRNTTGSGYALSSSITTGTSTTIEASGDDFFVSGTPANTIIWTLTQPSGYKLQNKNTLTYLKIGGSTFTLDATGSSNLQWSSKGLNGQSGSGKTQYYVMCSNGTFSASSTTGSTTDRVWAYEKTTVSVKTQSNFTTTCCTELAQINGSFNEATQTTGVLKWKQLSDQVSEWAVTYREKNSGNAFAAVTTSSTTTETISEVVYNKYTISELAAGKTYEFKLTPTLKTGVCPLSEDLIVEGSTQAAYTINAASSNTDHGTVSLNGVVITAAPATGYGYANPAYTVTSGTANVSQNGNDFTVTPSSDCTVRINFEQQNYAVTMAKSPANADVTISTNQSNKHYGDEITVSVTNHDGYLFDGWEASPAVTFADASAESTTFTMPASNVTVTAKFIKVLTVAEARDVIDGNDETAKQGVYVKGIISQIDSYNSTYNSITYWISDDGTTTNQMEVYGGKAGNFKTAFGSKDDLVLGDEVVVTGNITDFTQGQNKIYEFSLNSTIYSLKRLNSISVKTAPDDVKYTANEQFDPAGLVITLNYTKTDANGANNEPVDVAYNNTTAAGFTFSPTTSANLNATNTAVTITYKGKSVDQAITVSRIATELGWSAASYTATQGADYSFPTLTTITPAAIASSVTYSSTNTDVATINASGVITVKTHGTTTIKADFAQTNVYAAATTASYTLTINEDMTPRLVVDPNSLSFIDTPKDDAEGKTFNLVGTHLTANATLAITSETEGDAAMFSVVASVDKNGSGAINSNVTVTYTPTVAGNHAATLTISSTGAADVTVALSGTALETDIYKSALHTEIAAWSDYDAGKKMAGNGYNVPNPGSVTKGSDNCEGNHYRFAGWVEDADKEAPAGNIIAASGTKNASGKVYWAVWEKETATGPDTYEMTTSVAVNDVVVIAEIDHKADGKAGKELVGFGGNNSDYGTGADFATLPAGTIEWTVVDGYESTGVAFKNNSNKYLDWPGSNKLDVVSALSASSSWSVETNSERAKITNNSTTTRVICWNESSTGLRFAAYDNKTHGQAVVTNQDPKFYYPVFYKKVPGVVYGDPITYCCTPHDITISNVIEHGTVEADPESACAGTEVELTATPDEGYEFGSWTVTYVDGESQQQSVTVENNKFSMPDFETTVSATFTKIAVTAVTINGYSSVAKGDNITLTLDITPSTARPTVVWSSSNDAIATVVDGVVTGEAQGSVTITAKVDGTDYTKDITVTRETKLNSITVVNPKTTYTLNEAFVAPQVNANYLYVDDESEAPTVESVDGATFTGFDNQTAVAEQTITVNYGSKSTTYTIAVSGWTLNLQTKAQTGPAAVTSNIVEVPVNTYGSEIDLTNYYVENLCSAYTQVGFIASSTDVNSEIEPENLLTAYTPTADNQTLYAVFSHTGYTGKVLVDEKFSSITEASSNAEISASDFSWIASESKVFPEVGYVKYGSGSYTGSITTIELDLSHKFKVSLDVKKYSNDGANITITADETDWTSSTSFNTSEFTSINHVFDAVGEDKQITIETSSAKRAYIDNIKIETLDEVDYTSVYDCRSDMTVTYVIATADAEAGATGACEQETVKQGNDYTVCTNEPTWAGHTFAGWSDGESIVGATIVNVQAPITLTATWNEIVADEISISSDDITAGVMTLDDGRKATLTVTFDPENTYNKTITWSTDSHYDITDKGDGTYELQAKNYTTEALTVTATTANSKSASFTLTINQATKLTGLTLVGLTTANTVYTIGDEFSTEGVVVNTTVNMGDAPQGVEATFSEPDMTTSGVKTITVEYEHAEYGPASTTYEITVNPWNVKLYKNETLMSDVTITSTSQTVTLPTEETEGWASKVTGYHMAGFAKAADAIAPSYAPGATYTPTGDATLYGLYTANMPTYTLIGSANDLEIGRSIIIATKDAASDEKYYAIAELKYNSNGQSNNRGGVDVSKGDNGTTLTSYAGATEFILMEGKETGTYALYDPINGGYLCATNTANNYMRLEETLSVYGSWTITPNTVTAYSGTRNCLFFNYNGGNTIFSCYQSTAQNMKEIAVYQSDVPVKYDLTQDLVIESDQTLNTADVDQSVNVIVKDGVKLTVGSALSVNDFTIESQAGSSGQLVGTNVNVTGDIYMDVKFYTSANDATEATLNETEANQWYMISAPFDVNLNDGFINIATGNAMVFGQDFDLFEYDGLKRANTGVTGWTRVQSQMPAGTACLIGFNEGQSTTIRLKAASNTISDPDEIELESFGNASLDADNANWNGVANPTMHYITLNDADLKVQVYENDEENRGYQPYAASSNSFVVGTAFFIHRAEDVNLSSTINGSLRAPKRATSADKYEYCVQIAREGATTFANQMYVRATEEATAQYEYGHDVETLNGVTAKHALIWTENYGKRLAVEEAPLVNNQAIYALGIYAPNAGKYTISVPTEREDANLYLTYNGRVIWNLSMSPYEVELTKGTTNEYGLKIVAAPQVITDIEQSTISNQPSVQKVIIDDKVFILRGEQLFDVTGKTIR